MTQPEDDEPEAVANSISIEGDLTGNVLQVGQLFGDIHQGSSGVAKSRYLATVRDFAPKELIGRAAELAELREFCRRSDPAPDYVWWRAEAWSGKTALMASFVLDPPEGVRLVPFLITAREGGYDTRVGFLSVVIEQLAELVRIRIPEGDAPSNFRDLLVEAAKRCADRGERLVLVVDGLDEDRDAGEDGGARSIAALLPRNPAHGLRVIVAGRPNPGIPPALSDDHPLRDPAIVRELAPSPAASSVRYTMETDLRRLLDKEAGRAKDVLGLLVAARGGLSRPDLVELIGDEEQVGEILDSIQGRVFCPQRARWNPGNAPDIYLLGHEALHAEATLRLGEPALRGYRRQLAEWAEQVWAQGWPPSTPQFLLQGYPRLLREGGELGRMVDCVTDLARQKRLAEVSGGDEAAQIEIAAAHAAVFASAKPDVLGLVKLTMHRDDLSDRNARTPARLPALWARLGDVDRAEALVRSISEPFRRAAAVGELVEVLVEDRHVDRADRLIAETVDDEQQPNLRRQLVRAVAAQGDYARARSIAESIAGSDQRKRALLTALAAVPGTEPDLVLAAAEEIEGENEKFSARYFVAIWLVRHDEVARAIRLSEGFAKMYRTWVIDRAARHLLAAGEQTRARQVVELLEESDARELLFLLDVEALARKNFDLALAELDTVEDEDSREWMARDLVSLAIELDDLDRAESLLAALRPFVRQLALLDVLRALGCRGLHDRAVRLLGTEMPASEARRDRSAEADAFTALAEGALSSGAVETARVLAGRAEAAARHVSDSYQIGYLFQGFVAFAVDSKDVALAERLARLVIETGAEWQGVEEIARFLAESGDPGLAESLAFHITRTSTVMNVVVPLLRRLRETGDSEEVRRIAARVDEREQGFEGARFSSSEVLEAVEFDCAAALPQRALERIAELQESYGRSQALRSVVKEFCAIGEIESAVEIAIASDLVEALAEGMGEAGYRDGIETLDRIGGDHLAVAQLFLERLAGHDGELAFELAKSSLKSYERPTALLAIAGQVGEPLRSRVLAQAMLDDIWPQVLSGLSPDERPGLADVVDQFIQLQEARLGLRPDSDRPDHR